MEEARALALMRARGYSLRSVCSLTRVSRAKFPTCKVEGEHGEGRFEGGVWVRVKGIGEGSCESSCATRCEKRCEERCAERCDKACERYQERCEEVCEEGGEERCDERCGKGRKESLSCEGRRRGCW